MTDKTEATQVTAAENAEWKCRHCQHLNLAEAEHCANCAFHRDYDPEATPAIDFTSVKVQLEHDELQRRSNLVFYFQAATAVCSLLVLIIVIAMSVFLMRNWPFQQAYTQDANNLADTLMAVQANVQLGVSLGDYEELLVPLVIEKTKFQTIYSSRPQGRSSSYQKLIQAAEYYSLAFSAWEQALISSDATRRASPSAKSSDAGDDVTQYWNRAGSNLTFALEDLH